MSLYILNCIRIKYVYVITCCFIQFSMLIVLLSLRYNELQTDALFFHFIETNHDKNQSLE